MTKKIRHIHIPKTGGTYLKNAFFFPFYEKSIILGEDYDCAVDKKRPHKCWYDIDDNSYIITSFRDPVERTVSHYCELMNRTPEIPYASINKFRQWINENNNYISNFQSKNILYTLKDDDDQQNAIFFYKLKGFLEIDNIEKDKLLQRLKRIDLLIKDSQITPSGFKGFAKKMISDLDSKVDNNFFSLETIINYSKQSKELYNMLSPDDIANLQEINYIDLEVYNNNNLFWNGGQ
jgi:hypothetical protein